MALQNIRSEDFAGPNSFFRFGRDPHGIDILPNIPGVDFDDAWERRVEGVIDEATGFKAYFISAADLVAAEIAAGRPQDLADAAAVKAAQESPSEKERSSQE